jgi:hypothetical protein
MRRAAAPVYGLWGFLVGDDWRTALGVVLALIAVAGLAEAGISAWWLMPPAVLSLLALSVARAARSAQCEQRQASEGSRSSEGASMNTSTSMLGPT